VEYDPKSPDYWREQAARARRLAKEMLSEEFASRLNRVAEEFETQAAILEAERTAKAK
jgi:hypothetical protein